MTITAFRERNLEHIPVVMVREDLTTVPSFPLPPGYRLRCYRRGEAPLWAEIEVSVGEFPTLERALAHFEKEFGPYPDDLEKRCLFLEDAAGRALGTATAWFHNLSGPEAPLQFQGKDYGRIHWVAIRPEHQGRKLAKPLLAAALRRLAQFHSRAYLTTQTTSARAIHLYLDLGFVPLVLSERCSSAWRLLAALLEHPALEEYQ